MNPKLLQRMVIGMLGKYVPPIPYSDVVLGMETASLIRYWPLNEAAGAQTVADLAMNTTAVSTTATLGADGLDGTAASFDGTQFVNIYSAPFDTAFSKTEITISAWCKVSEIGVWAEASNHHVIDIQSDGSNYISITKPATENRLTISYVAGGTIKQVNIASLAPTKYFHLVVTVSKTADQMIAYIDGVQVGATQTGLGTWTIGLEGTRCAIGSYQSGTAMSAWKGSICHVAVWKKALTASQVYSLYRGLTTGIKELTNMVTLATMPTAVYQHGLETLGGLIYAVGGQTASGNTCTGATQCYDPSTNLWSAKTDLPIAVQSPILRAVNGKLYCIGGYDSGIGVFYPRVYEYDPVGNTWTRKTDGHLTREDAGSAVINGKIYCFGGLQGSTNLYKSLDIYDPATDTWDNTKADMPDVKLLGDFGEECGGKAYALGATNTMTDYPTLHPIATSYVYDPATNIWSTIADHPAPRCYSEAVQLNGLIYQIGGAIVNNTTPVKTIYTYNPNTDTWAVAGSITTAQTYLPSVACGDSIYICGGFTSIALNTAYKLTR